MQATPAFRVNSLAGKGVMGRAVRTGTLLLCGLILFAPLASAGDEEAGEPELSAQVSNAEGGAKLVVSGAANYPDGTVLKVTCHVKGKFEIPIEAAFFKVQVKGGGFEVTKEWRGQALAPLEYVVKADLWMEDQNKAVKSTLAAEYGYSPRYRGLVAGTVIAVGEEDERNEFQRATLLTLRDQLVELQGLCARSVELCQGESADAEWVAGYKALAPELLKHKKARDAFLKRYIVWHERPLIEKLKGGLAGISRALRDFKKGQGDAARDALERVTTSLERALEAAEARLPKRESE